MNYKIIRWAEPLGDKSCPYCYRWVLDLWLFSIRLHHWVFSDDLRAKHDHPYDFVTIILSGGYVDMGEVNEFVGPGSVRFRWAEHKHSVKLISECWSLILTGPPRRIWGFWLGNKFLRREKYFKEYGHQCD